LRLQRKSKRLEFCLRYSGVENCIARITDKVRVDPTARRLCHNLIE
jgi:hypothetical protein